MTAPRISRALLLTAAALLIGVGFAWVHSPFNRDHTVATDKHRKAMKTPLIQGRVATQEDVDSGVAIFHVPDGRSAPYSFGRSLPLTAEIVKPDGDEFPLGRHVQIVQAEITDGKHVTLGVIDGIDEKVCALDDVRVLD